jgi:predicted ATPase
MSVEAISLRNFRGFRAAEIELKPLTVLLGPNSSGKSSFGHAISAMTHAHRAHVSSNRPTLSPISAKDAQEWPVDLGSLKDLRTSGVQERVYIGLRTGSGWVEFGFGHIDETDLRLSYIRHPFGVNVSTTKIVEEATAQTPLFEAITKIEVSNVVASEETGIPRVELVRVNEREWQFATRPITVSFEGMVLLTASVPGATELLLNGTARTDLKRFFEGSTYLRATRERPLRGYIRGRGERQEIGYSGEWTATVLADRGSIPIQISMPPAIPRNIDEARVTPREWAMTNTNVSSGVQFWLQHLGLASSMQLGSDHRDSDRLDTRFTLEEGQESHDITEVGFGLSQVLPVITAGLLQSGDGVLIVDLPEAHLHPRPQAALADFFCSLALSGRRCLVETHSEMFFHRLRLRAEMTPELREKVAVYFADPPDHLDCRQPRRIGLRMEDELRWPPGFLQEGWELESEIEAVRAASEK